MRKKIKRGGRAAAQTLAAPVAWLYRGVATCLMYHRIAAGGVGDRPHFDPNRELFVSEEEFEKQMRHVARNYDPLSLDEAIERLTAGRLPRRSVIVTFDDGYRDNLLALPALRQYGVPATIYVATGPVSRTRAMWWDEIEAVLGSLEELNLDFSGQRHYWRLGTSDEKNKAFRDLNGIMKSLRPGEQDALLKDLRTTAGASDAAFFGDETILSWEEVRDVAKDPLITIGAHTEDHFVMSQLSGEELEAQLRRCQAQLRERADVEAEHFAYPFGGLAHAGEREFEMLSRSGFKSAVTTRPGHWYARSRERLFSLPRIPVGFSDTEDDFRWKMGGLYMAARGPRSLFTDGSDSESFRY